MYVVTFALVLLASDTSLGQTEVVTNVGTISGLISDPPVEGSNYSVFEYRGIRYAQPPTAQNRFKPPVKAEPSSELFNATEYGASCPQDSRMLSSILRNPDTTYERFIDSKIDEDCLFLNIYRRYRDETMNSSTSQSNNAVMVFFHGGDFVSGTGSAYAGNVLSSLHDVIVVTVNYRLGALGFLSDGSASLPGNYGILDQQMALRWIKDNIEAFGGNPELVTIFGSGAGGSSVHLHTVIESSKSLFAKAIVQSATYNDAVWTKETAREQYNILLKNLGIDLTNDLETQLADIPWEELQQALPGPWSPVISDLIPMQTREAMKNPSNVAGIDVLVGSNDLDANHIVVDGVDFDEDDWYRSAVRDITDVTSEFNDWTEEDVNRRMLLFNTFYMGAGRDIETIPETVPQIFPTSSITRMYTDQIFGTWAHETAMAHSSFCSCNVYKYIFKRRPSNKVSLKDLTSGAVHGQELAYIFGFITDEDDDKVSDEDKELSHEVMKMWTEFSKTGNLSKNFPEWQTFNAISKNDSCRSTVILDVKGAFSTPNGPTQNDNLLTSRNWDFWKDYYRTLGVSCSAESEDKGGNNDDPDDGPNDGPDDGPDVCEAGVWSDAGVVMSNETAGALLITFIVLTAVLLIAFIWTCHCYNKAKRKVRKVIQDDGSSVISNASTRM